MERDVQAARQRLAAGMRPASPQPSVNLPDTLRELRGEIERLRAEVKELSKKVDGH